MPRKGKGRTSAASADSSQQPTSTSDRGAGSRSVSALTKGPADTQVPLPLSDKLSVLQGKINHMGPAQIRRELKLRGKCEQGEVKVLRARLKHQVLLQKLGEHFDDSDQSSVAAKKAAASARSTSSPPPAMICVMDFEATCIEEDPGRCFPNEIIEFPVVLVDRETRTVVAEFQRYVKPTNNPVLSSFCTRLTGITQEQVDGAAPFPVVFEEMLSWLKGLGHLPGDGGGGGGDNGDGADGESAGGGGAGGEGASVGPMCIFATDGPWDIRDFLRMQFKMSGLGHVPNLFHSWVNIRKHFNSYFKGVRFESGASGIEGMLKAVGMTFQGRPHCGLDDTKNLARLVVQLLDDGCRMDANDRLSNYQDKRIKQIGHMLRDGSVRYEDLQHGGDGGAAAGSSD